MSEKRHTPRPGRGLCDDQQYRQATLHGSLTALCFGTGALVLQERVRCGIAVPRIGETEFRQFIAPVLKPSDIERIALRVGHDASVGWLLREVLSEGHDLGIPSLDAWIRQSMRGGDLDQSELKFGEG